jgi:hypothetical protein
MSRTETAVRDRGVALISRVNRWLIAGAIGLSGVMSVAVASAFKGHQRPQAGQAATQQQPTGGGGSLGQPAPTPAPSSGAGSAVVSGGS